MGKFGRELSIDLIEFIRRQRIFFTGSAPNDGARVNVSPKGYDSLAVIDPTHLAYYDYAGSGNETAHHVRENQRLTLMWCSFEEKPLILRTYLRARVLEPTSEEFHELMARHWPDVRVDTVRQIFWGEIEAMQTSCGFGVPFFDYLGERPTMANWSAKKADDGTLFDYIEKNSERNDQKFPIEISAIP